MLYKIKNKKKEKNKKKFFLFPSFLVEGGEKMIIL